MQPGVGKGQAPGLQDQIVVKKQIEIKGAFGPAFAAKAAMPVFDLVQYLQKGNRVEGGGNLDHGVEIETLSRRTARRFTFVQGRSRDAVDLWRRAKLLPRRQEMSMAITEVGTESDKGANGRTRGGKHDGN